MVGLGCFFSIGAALEVCCKVGVDAVGPVWSFPPILQMGTQFFLETTPLSEVDILCGYSRKTFNGDYREWVIQGSSRTFVHSPHILHVFHDFFHKT